MPEASAPGKLIIFGEYAVMDGAPAIATAVDVRARAYASPSEDHDSVLVDALSGQSHHFSVDDAGKLHWRNSAPGARGTILEAVFITLREKLKGRSDWKLRFSINTESFYAETGGSVSKLGLGSSAAALVAFVGAFMRSAGLTATDADLLDICCTAHRTFQGGQGSGIDIATALTGGVVGIRPGQSGEVPAVTPVNWPDGLLMLPVWSGSSASTPELLARFNDYRERDSGAFETNIHRLKSLAEAAYTEWSYGTVKSLLPALAAYDSALRAMDRDGAIGINTDTHDLLRGLSEQHGAIYKTSGAGGGDFGLALSDSPDAIEALRISLSASGYVVLEGSPGAEGLTILD
jgi:phosphomevalonate kinase